MFGKKYKKMEKRILSELEELNEFADLIRFVMKHCYPMHSTVRREIWEKIIPRISTATEFTGVQGLLCLEDNWNTLSEESRGLLMYQIDTIPYISFNNLSWIRKKFRNDPIRKDKTDKIYNKLKLVVQNKTKSLEDIDELYVYGGSIYEDGWTNKDKALANIPMRKYAKLLVEQGKTEKVFSHLAFQFGT